ncbi:hypothetical protein BDF20DRAFT_913886 [Mycotypha africana]|uniref:uncharacterized protein n=1 Tax=Mycotypha africana TaxID=64632 RepID=UPI00230129A5|nr:uncharacterized protein BDF20DRAFT_913886 [Mycotypha africana]KAI8977569.1 hypothetical protein BDF20DRAFT_913886 [Mycotypha africana]
MKSALFHHHSHRSSASRCLEKKKKTLSFHRAPLSPPPPSSSPTLSSHRDVPSPFSQTTSAVSSSSSLLMSKPDKRMTTDEHGRRKGDTQPPPPFYDDPSHPWAFSFSGSVTHSRTTTTSLSFPPIEEGNEILPEYECTLNKVACLNVKCEYIKSNLKAKQRSWKRLYIHVYGTKIMAFHKNPLDTASSSSSSSITTALTSFLSLRSTTTHNAQVTLATDYLKYRHVLRLTLNEGGEGGPHFLFTFKTLKEKLDWLFTLESSINISSDIDIRPMPKAMTVIHQTLPRRRRRPQRQNSSRRQQ